MVLGPGMGHEEGPADALAQALLQVVAPLLLDADALTLLAQAGSAQELCEARAQKGHALLLTPHAGELERLLKATGTQSPQQLARVLHATVVAKGPITTIASEDRSIFSALGTAALAKAGTGDVLAGVIGSLVAQGVAPFEAAALGVYLHSQAGVLAQARLGMRSVMAEDVLDALAAALVALETLEI
jgi:hydroxyethylthiazole kinase-like uncharacterized protein yjeF